MLFPIAATISLYAYDLIYLWTGNARTAASVAPLASLLVWGTALNGVMYFPYALQLAFGRTRLPLTINAILIAVSAPITVILTATYGVIGGAASWLILNGIYLLLGTWLTHRLLLPRVGGGFARNVAVPMLVSLLVVAIAAWVMQDAPSSSLVRALLAAVAALGALAINVSLDRTAIERFVRSVRLGSRREPDSVMRTGASETSSR